MESLINKIVALFDEGETQMEWWDLRERALAKMKHPEWISGFAAAWKGGNLDYDRETQIVSLPKTEAQ